MRRIPIPGCYRRAGFTLMELALVLLIVVFLLGILWTTAENAWNNYRIYRTTQQIVRLTQNVREYYMNAQNLLFLGPATTNITKILDGQAPNGVNQPNGLFPMEMRRYQASRLFGSGPGGPIDHPFNSSLGNGSLQVIVENCPLPATTKGTCFRVELLGLSQQTCMQLVTYFPINNTDLGIAQFSTPQTGFLVQYPTAVITPSQAQQWCQQGSKNEIDIDFKLHN